MSFKEKFKNLRKEKGLSQVELAEKLGTTQKVVSDYERGRTSPPKERLPLIAKFFGITIDELLDSTNDKNVLNSKIKTIHGKKRTAKVTELYDMLTPEEQRVVLRQIRGLIAERKNGTPLHR
jgi:transcriptional regulator with XRE-family HTH domain